MDDQRKAELRLECLRLAEDPAITTDVDEVLGRAKKFSEFVLGGPQAS